MFNLPKIKNVNNNIIMNDRIHLNLAEAYEKADDNEGAAVIYEKALKKYKKSKKVWMAYQHFRLR